MAAEVTFAELVNEWLRDLVFRRLSSDDRHGWAGPDTRALAEVRYTRRQVSGSGLTSRSRARAAPSSAAVTGHQRAVLAVYWLGGLEQRLTLEHPSAKAFSFSPAVGEPTLEVRVLVFEAAYETAEALYLTEERRVGVVIGHVLIPVRE